MTTSILVKSIIENTYANSTEINTALSNNETKWDFINAINEPHYVRILFENTTQSSKIYGSATAKDLILKSQVALDTIGSSLQACKNFFNTPSIAKEVLLNKGLFLLFRNNFKTYSNMKACVNETKLKRVILSSMSESVTIPATECMSFFGIGGGGSGGGTGSSTYSGGGGLVKVDKSSTPQPSVTFTVTSIGAYNASTISNGTSTVFSAATGGMGTQVGRLSDLDDRDFLNAPFLFTIFSSKGEQGTLYDSGNPSTYPTTPTKAGGEKGFTEWGRGEIPSLLANSGIIVIYYLES